MSNWGCYFVVLNPHDLPFPRLACHSQILLVACRQRQKNRSGSVFLVTENGGSPGDFSTLLMATKSTRTWKLAPILLLAITDLIRLIGVQLLLISLFINVFLLLLSGLTTKISF